MLEEKYQQYKLSEKNNQKTSYEKNNLLLSSSNLENNYQDNLFSDNNKENYDSNKKYEITDNSQSAINPLNKSRNNLNTSNNLNIPDIFTAVEYNDIDKVNELLKKDPSQINELNEEGLSLLHIAVIKANLKMVDLLLSYGADPNILTDKKKQTPLHLAYLNQNSLTEEIVQELLKNNAHETVLDVNNKKPSDYMLSTYKKKQKKFNIYENDNNCDLNNESDKKNYIGNNTGNTVTLITMDNHLDSFLTTNKEDDIKSNQNNANSNNNTIIQSPNKLEVNYDFNELISINNSVEKNNSNQLNNNKYKNDKNDVNKKKRNRRQYTFGKDEEYFQFLNKNNDLYNDINNNINNKSDKFDLYNNLKNNNIQNIQKNMNNAINKNSSNNIFQKENNLDDSLENNEKVENEDTSIELFKNNNIKNNNKDNNTQSISNIYNNSILSYTDSCIQSKYIVTNNTKLNNESINNTNENKNTDGNEEIILKSPFNDNNIEESQNKEKDKYKDELNDILFKKIIIKKRNSFAKQKSNKLFKTSKNERKINLNKKIRNNSLNNIRPFELEENDNFDNSLKTNRNNFISPLNLNNIQNDIKNIKEINNYNIAKLNNSYKNSNTIVHNGTDSGRVSGNNSQYSTYTQSLKRKKYIHTKDYNRIKVNINNNNNSYMSNLNNNSHKITEFHCTDNNNYIFNSNTSSYNNIYSNENPDNNYRNISLLKYWLNNIGLIEYLDNFTNNSIYDINKLIERMKSYQTKLRFDNLEPILKIKSPGYIYRILCKLEADAGLIDPKIVKFMIREGENENKNILTNNTNNNELKLSLSQNYKPCLNCCKMKPLKRRKKNDLKFFLIRYNLLNLYQNFYHNGFDMIEYVIMQMYSSFPINEDILENNFHMYDDKQRSATLKAIVSEMKKINNFLNSDEYNNCDKNKIKYDNVFFEENEYKEISKISIKSNTNNNQPDCVLF